MTRIGGWRIWAAVGAALVSLAATPEPDAHPNALWRVVHWLCLPDQVVLGHPAPCLAVDRARGYAVVPDPEHRTQVLLVPTRRVTGIESPALLAADSPNYWQDAWEARRFLERRARRALARDEIALAINARTARTQNQLHIHVDCIRPDVRAILAARLDEVDLAWSPLDVPLAGRLYWARRLDGADLLERDPFKMLARGLPEARDDMGRFSLAVIGMTFADGAPGFVLLADGGPAAFAESLLDHDCTLLREPARQAP
jgi:CDP-diacylglycerol pyrophosphatase